LAFKKKKGQIDIILLIVILLISFAIISYVGYGVITDLNDEIQGDSSLGESTKNVSNDIQVQYPSFNDGLFIFMFGLFFIGGLVAAYFSDVTPFYYVIFIVVTVFLMIAGGLISNTWDDFSSDAEYSGYDASFPMTDWVMDNYILVLSITLGSSFLAVFLKSRVF